jgi:hypothetical protein
VDEASRIAAAKQNFSRHPYDYYRNIPNEKCKYGWEENNRVAQHWYCGDKSGAALETMLDRADAARITWQTRDSGKSKSHCD